MKITHVIRTGLLGGLAALALTTGLQPARADEAPQGLGPLAVYDQTNGASGDSVISVNIPGVDDNIAADDFSVAAEWWIISQVRAVGSLPSSAPNSMLVEIYQTSTNGFSETVPGIKIYSKTSSQFTQVSAPGDYSITLPTVAILRPSATYWLAVQAQYSTFAAWSWNTRTAQTGAAAAYRGSTITDCQVFRPRAICDATPGADQLYSITYTPFVPATVIYLPLLFRQP